MIAIGATLAVLSSPEHAFVSALCLMLLVHALGDDQSPHRARIYLAISTVGFVAVQVWQRVAGGTGSRLDRLLDVSVTGSHSLQGFLQLWPLSVYSWLGPLWIIVLLAASELRGRRGLTAILAVVVVPAFFTIITLDGTRVFVSIGLVPLVVLIRSSFETRWRRHQPSDRLLGLRSCACCCSPPSRCRTTRTSSTCPTFRSSTS